MATNFRSIARQLVYAALNGNVAGVTIYDHVPFEPEGSPDSNFPYGTVGDAEAIPFDNDTDLGADVTTSVHVWSRYKGRKEVDEALDAIYGLLHRASLSAAGYRRHKAMAGLTDGNSPSILIARPSSVFAPGVSRSRPNRWT